MNTHKKIKFYKYNSILLTLYKYISKSLKIHNNYSKIIKKYH